MSYQDGISALNLKWTKRVPRTEGGYSAERHWDLVKAVTGFEVGPDSPAALQEKASCAFVKAWNYDWVWSTLIYNEAFGDLRTSMGHAIYDAGGGDFRDDRDAKGCPFKDPEEILNLDFWKAYGEIDRAATIRRFEQHYRDNCRKYPDAVNMTGIYVTCISAFIEIFGWDMFLLAAGTDLKRFGEMANRYAEWVQQYFDALAASDVPVVMIHDDLVWSSGAFLPPKWYRQYVFPNFHKYFEPLHKAGKIIFFTSDGNYTEFIDDIADTGIRCFVMEPGTDIEYIAKKYGQTHAFTGNADTRVLLNGTKAEIRAEVERVMNIGKECPGFFMSVGNHIPSNTPVESALYYNEVYKELSER